MFIISAGAILLVTGVAKLWSATGTAGLLAQNDPVFRIPFREILVLASVMELVVSGFCIFGRSNLLKISLIACLSTQIAIYRAGLWWVGWEKPCNCLGGLSDALHLSPTVADDIIKTTLLYLCVGSYLFLAFRWNGRETRGVGTRMSL